MSDKNMQNRYSRRDFIRIAGQVSCVGVLGGIAYRVFTGVSADAEFDQPTTRYAWQINNEKCTFCSICESACVRKPSAVKAVNDQKKCSFCVICYGHITNKTIDSDKVNSDGIRVCPQDAVLRRNYSGGLDGYYIYSIDDERCDGCGKCAKFCNEYGTKSMFLIIRPDLCLGCNRCAIAEACPEKAVERIPIASEDDFRGEYGLDDNIGYMMIPENEG